MTITKRSKVKFSINVDHVNEVEYEVAPLDACEVMFGGPYLWDRDVTSYKKENKISIC
jgi:hypothetical protein